VLDLVLHESEQLRQIDDGLPLVCDLDADLSRLLAFGVLDLDLGQRGRSPIPPAPMAATISYGPRRLPG
jgi:hypothetical protein